MSGKIKSVPSFQNTPKDHLVPLVLKTTGINDLIVHYIVEISFMLGIIFQHQSWINQEIMFIEATHVLKYMNLFSVLWMSNVYKYWRCMVIWEFQYNASVNVQIPAKGQTSGHWHTKVSCSKHDDLKWNVDVYNTPREWTFNILEQKLMWNFQVQHLRHLLFVISEHMNK